MKQALLYGMLFYFIPKQLFARWPGVRDVGDHIVSKLMLVETDRAATGETVLAGDEAPLAQKVVAVDEAVGRVGRGEMFGTGGALIGWHNDYFIIKYFGGVMGWREGWRLKCGLYFLISLEDC